MALVFGQIWLVLISQFAEQLYWEAFTLHQIAYLSFAGREHHDLHYFHVVITK